MKLPNGQVQKTGKIDSKIGFKEYVMNMNNGAATRKNLFWSSQLMAALACSVVAIGADNLVPEGDFESGLSVYEAQGADAKCFFVIDESTANKGSKSLACLPNETENKIALRKSGIVLDSAKKYKLSVVMKGQDADFGKMRGVLVINEGWHWSSPALTPAPGTSDWTEHTTIFQPKLSSNDKYQLVIFPPIKGNLWVDNIRLEEDTPATVASNADGPAVAASKNKLRNSNFANDMKDWMIHEKLNESFRIEAGGTKGEKCLVITGYSGKMTLRQGNIELNPEKQYTLSAWMKSEDLEPASTPWKGLFIINEGWHSISKCLPPPEKTSDWQRYSVTFTIKASSNGKYQLVIAGPEKGKLWIDSIQLEEGTGASDYVSN